MPSGKLFKPMRTPLLLTSPYLQHCLSSIWVNVCTHEDKEENNMAKASCYTQWENKVFNHNVLNGN